MTYAKAVTLYHRSAAANGIAYEDAETLRRAAMTLHRWAEHECNGVIQRVEGAQTDHRGRPMIEGACYSVSNINGPSPLHYYRTADRETPAIKRAQSRCGQVFRDAQASGRPSRLAAYAHAVQRAPTQPAVPLSAPMNHTMTTQRQVRAAFWEMADSMNGSPITRRKLRDGDYTCDTRAAFCDFVEGLRCNGTISEALAQRVTL